MRVRRTSFLVLLLVLATSATGFGLARSARDENEHRLLELQADEMTSLFQSLRGQYQTAVTTASVVAERTGGDPQQFAAFVGSLKESGGGKWFVLRRNGDALATQAVVGTSNATTALASNRTPAVDTLVDRAFQGEFVVVGIFGAGAGRTLALASGVPGRPGDQIVYVEYPLLAAAAASPATTDKATSGLALLDLAVYIGAPTPDNLLIQTTPNMHARQVQREVQIGSTTITMIVAAKKPLSGAITSELPWILLAVGLLCGGVMFVTTELTLRRRDHAVSVAAELADKNDALDRALVERDEADRARAALEEELRQAQRLEAVGQLAGGIAHDFNNLLAAILSFSDLAAEDLGDHPAQADVAEIRNAARRGAALTRQLLLFSRHERGVPELVDLNAVVEDLERLLARTLGEDVRLLTGLQPDLPPVLVETGELEQVVMNLVVNARDSGGSTITIETAAVNLDSVDVALRPSLSPGPYVQLTVSDTGTGIAPEVLPRIFEPFFTNKERGRGTGLGLATAYGIVQRSGGHIAVQSTSSRGTVFEVLLPAISATEECGDPTIPPDLVEGQGQTVLCVEDQDQVRAAVGRVLERHGYSVLSAHDGPSAYASYGAAPIDLLLTDVILPGGMTGPEVASRFHESRPWLPVVYMSGYSDDYIRPSDGGDATSVILVRKPYAAEELLRAIADALQVAIVAT